MVLICLSVWTILRLCQPADPNTDFTAESLRWTKIGAIGSWAGSVFGAVALVMSIFAFWLPQKVKIDANITSGYGLSHIPEVNSIAVWIITVKNAGIRPITVDNIYLNFGEKEGDVFVGMISEGTPFDSYMPKFPRRLNQGEAFNFYMPVEELREGLKSISANKSLDANMRIVVDEVITGKHYFKTECTLRTFVTE